MYAHIIEKLHLAIGGVFLRLVAMHKGLAPVEAGSAHARQFRVVYSNGLHVEVGTQNQHAGGCVYGSIASVFGEVPS